MPTIQTNGAQIYYKAAGSGPAPRAGVTQRGQTPPRYTFEA